MKTYWDLSEQDRARLSHEDVSRYLDAELMTKGVLKPPTLNLAPVPEAPKPEIVIYTVAEEPGFRTFDAAFTTNEAALAFIALGPRFVDHDYRLDAKHMGDHARSLVVQSTTVYSKGQLVECAATTARAKEVRDDNDSRRREYETMVRAQTKALEGLWSDWHACRAKAERCAKVEATRAEYLALTGGDVALAETFLAKAFEEPARVEAKAWSEIPF